MFVFPFLLILFLAEPTLQLEKAIPRPAVAWPHEVNGGVQVGAHALVCGALGVGRQEHWRKMVRSVPCKCHVLVVLPCNHEVRTRCASPAAAMSRCSRIERDAESELDRKKQEYICVCKRVLFGCDRVGVRRSSLDIEISTGIKSEPDMDSGPAMNSSPSLNHQHYEIITGCGIITACELITAMKSSPPLKSSPA